MGKKIIINVEEKRKRVAIVVDDVLEEIHFERDSSSRLIGNIYRGKINRVMPGIEAAFIDIGLEKNGFLHISDMTDEGRSLKDAIGEDLNDADNAVTPLRRKSIEDYLTEGDNIIIQILKDAIGTKGVRLTTNISLPGRYVVFVPRSARSGISRRIEDPLERKRLGKILTQLDIPASSGCIIRTFGEGKKLRDFSKDLRIQVQLWKKIYKNYCEKKKPELLFSEQELLRRVVRDMVSEDIDALIIDNTAEYRELRSYINTFFPSKKVNLRRYRGKVPIFEQHHLEEQVEKVFNRKVWLNCGGHIVIDKTEALVSIDVNTGRNIGTDDANATILETNLEAAEEIARQLRLRNMGGLVVIDFIDMRFRASQRKVYETLRRALRRDKAKVNILPISDLGLVEMTRQRDKESLGSELYVDCPGCRGIGSVKQPDVICADIERKLKKYLRKEAVTEINIRAHPRIINFLTGEEAPTIAAIIKDSRINIDYDAVDDYSIDEWLFEEELSNGQITRRA